jgi:hypothetical protein
MTPVLITTVAGISFVKWCIVGMCFNKGMSSFKSKEVVKSWSVTQFLEESRFVK